MSWQLEPRIPKSHEIRRTLEGRLAWSGSEQWLGGSQAEVGQPREQKAHDPPPTLGKQNASHLETGSRLLFWRMDPGGPVASGVSWPRSAEWTPLPVPYIFTDGPG